jgi:AcrR family transcriptional regulator
MPPQRLRREAQVERNRGQLLSAARRVFLKHGFHGATLDVIAEEAGFSKGVVYSQFDSKADLFLALLEARIAERAAQNERIVRETRDPAAAFAALVAWAERLAAVEPEWALLVLEFRTHAARDPALNARYAAAHARTVEGVGRALSQLLAGAGIEPAAPPQTLAALVLSVGAGLTLEKFARPDPTVAAAASTLLARAIGVSKEPT